MRKFHFPKDATLVINGTEIKDLDSAVVTIEEDETQAKKIADIAFEAAPILKGIPVVALLLLVGCSGKVHHWHWAKAEELCKEHGGAWNASASVEDWVYVQCKDGKEFGANSLQPKR